MGLGIFLLVVFVIEVAWSPRINITRENVLLFYGRRNRKYVILF